MYQNVNVKLGGQIKQAERMERIEMGFQFSKLASLKLSGWLYDLFGEIKNREFSEVFQPYWSSIDHEHVNCLVRVEHVSGSLLANDTA